MRASGGHSKRMGNRRSSDFWIDVCSILVGIGKFVRGPIVSLVRDCDRELIMSLNYTRGPGKPGPLIQ